VWLRSGGKANTLRAGATLYRRHVSILPQPPNNPKLALRLLSCGFCLLTYFITHAIAEDEEHMEVRGTTWLFLYQAMLSSFRAGEDSYPDEEVVGYGCYTRRAGLHKNTWSSNVADGLREIWKCKMKATTQGTGSGMAIRFTESREGHWRHLFGL
jgi:hypothetical protein